MCEISDNECTTCIEFYHNNKILTIKNDCKFDCNLNDWIVTGEGRAKLILNSTVEKDKEIVVNLQEILSDEDTLFVRDDNRLSVFYEIINLSFLSLY